MSGQPSQVGSHDRPGAWRRKAARWAAVFILLGYWMVYFYPVIGQGRVYMPYRYLENAGISGGWALLAAWWAARGRWIRTAAPAAACGLMLYCGHPEEALILSAVTAFALAGFTSWRGGTWKSAAARTALYGLILAGFSAVYIVPFLAGLGDSVSYKALWDGVHGYAPAALLNPAKMVWFPPLLWGLVSAAFFARVKGRRFAVALILVGGLVAFKWPHLGRVRTLLALNGTLIAIYAQTLLWLGVLWLAAMATQSLMEAPRKERGRLARALIYGFALYYAFSWGYATATGSLYWPGVYV
ncbi:MAG: hypothetical protein P8018_00870, partial [Acidobacteriota bacterium]